jgi:hypothetical protein
VDGNIRVYIRDRLVTNMKLKKWPPSVQDEITTVMEKAGGMYARAKNRVLTVDQASMGVLSTGIYSTVRQVGYAQKCIIELTKDAGRDV